MEQFFSDYPHAALLEDGDRHEGAPLLGRAVVALSATIERGQDLFRLFDPALEIAHGVDYSRFRQLYSLDPDSDSLYDEVVANSRAFAQPTFSNSFTALRLFAGKNLQSHQRGFPRTASIL